ncbi:MAG: GGDEF domain-containing protein [Lachnospiraceae bacterium]|nr:GGDEF domain-containing protein [Lachnospiraceae bacterium]
MKDEWKRFFIQWVLPVVIFAVALVFMLASFTANIKQETVTNYEEDMVVASTEYAANITSSLRKMEAVGDALIDVIVNNNLADFGASDALGPLVKNSDAYMALLVEENDKVVTEEGKSFLGSDLSYFDSAVSLNNRGVTFVRNDEIIGRAAFVVKMPVDNSTHKCVLLYYAVNDDTLSRLVTVSADADGSSFALLTDKDGRVLASTNPGAGFEDDCNFWEKIAPANNASTLKRIKTRVVSYLSGSFEAVIGRTDYITTYTPIKDTNYILLVNYNKLNVDKNENRQYRNNIKRLQWCLAVMATFIIVITFIQIAQNYVTSKNTTELKDKADTDQLTGLKNKLATEREIKEYITDHPDSLGMLFVVDIDNFKKINDTMGHAFGDEVLRELGRNIGINFRVSDIIGRSGGDEFMIFLKNLKEEQNTLREAQKLIYFFRHFQVGDYVKYSVTASIGAAVFPTNGADFETLYKAADAAVYKSKKRGKNQLSFFDDRDRTPEEVAEADAHLIDISRKEEE